MVNVCNVCDGTDFTINAGFYYCDNCGNRITVLQEIESQTVDPFNESVKIAKHKIKENPEIKAKKVELTTWEIYNYIIYGTVNGLICLGCKDELSVTTLQLWSYYLSRHEIAFFGSKETDLPKMPLGFRVRDLHILNNIPIKKKRRRSISSRSSGSLKITQRQKKLAATRTRKSLAESQYEEYMSSQKSDISSIGYNLSQPSSTAASSAEESEASVKVKFSQVTRRRARRKMTREHMLLHQNDVEKKLKCHRHRTNEEDKLGRPFVYAIIWMALNQVEDDLQFSDLIRFGLESHIKMGNISSYLPQNTDMKHAMFQFCQGGRDQQKYLPLRKKAYEIAKTVRLRQLKVPDLGRLCERYCKELCLPPVVAEMAKRLIAFYPPRMKISRRGALQGAVPNFEGRAMAFIIFIFKLIFGMDDEREIKMSQSAKRVNQKMIDLEIKRSPLFVFTEWKHYIEMRNHFLSKCHFPTAIHIDPNAHHSVDLYAEFVKQANEDNMLNESYKRKEMENISSIFEQVIKLHKSTKEKPNNSRHFAPSLTPYSSYFAQVLTDESLITNLDIPDYMHVRHDEYDLFSYIRPVKLKRAFEMVKQRLEIFQIDHNKNISFKPFSFDINFFQKFTYRFKFDLTTEDFIHKLESNEIERQAEYERQRQHYNECAKEMTALHINRLREKEMKIFREKHKTLRPSPADGRTQNDAISDTISEIPSYKYFDEDEKDIIDADLLHEPRRNLDFQPTILDYSSDEESLISTDDETPLSSLFGENNIDLLVSNFNYWISMESVSHLTIVRSSFIQKLKKLPKNFQWLLQQCALHLHMEPLDLYIELLAIESQFRYKLKPTFKMNNCYRYRDTAKLSKQLQYAVQTLNSIW